MTRSLDRKGNSRRKAKATSERYARKTRKASPPAKVPLIMPSSDAMRRYEAIPLLFGEAPNVRQMKGRVVFDSWAHGPAVALRDVGDGHVRRLRLMAGKLSLEILAERRRYHWEFVARVYRGQQVAHDCVLKVSSRSFLAASGGYFQWSSKHVPAKVDVHSYDHDFVFEKLVWQ